MLHSRARLGRSSVLTGLLALGLVGAQGASLAHFALVKHAYCAEHGELIHPDADYRAPPARPRSSKPSLYATEAVEYAHGHDHCALAGQRRESALPARAFALPVDGAGRVDAPLALAWTPFSGPRFRLAPKQSPPA
jgi:hypothetical protein